jgi:hypothetical protein
MDDKYAKEIRKTGFVLESQVANTLRHAGWTVISNKYYEDDFEGSVREIDLLAYKVSKVQEISVYTTLLVSCKKSEPDVWALLARPIDLKNPNADWWPLHAWSNNKAVLFHLAKANVAKTYHQDVHMLGVKEALAVPNYEVFAFQEMNRGSGAPHNDKNIFGAVTSLMKAQAYELGALSSRKKVPSVYQFNLISIIDSALYRLVVSGDEISQEQIESEHYVSRYIIKKREIFSRIRFVAASAFEEVLKDYGRLHEANRKWFDAGIDSFYEDILKDFLRAGILFPEFRAEVEWRIFSSVRKLNGQQLTKDSLGINWNAKDNCAEIYFFAIEPYLNSLNENEELIQKVSAALKKVYRYSGKFRFAVDDIPF